MLGFGWREHFSFLFLFKRKRCRMFRSSYSIFISAAYHGYEPWAFHQFKWTEESCIHPSRVWSKSSVPRPHTMLLSITAPPWPSSANHNSAYKRPPAATSISCLSASLYLLTTTTISQPVTLPLFLLVFSVKPVALFKLSPSVFVPPFSPTSNHLVSLLPSERRLPLPLASPSLPALTPSVCFINHVFSSILSL